MNKSKIQFICSVCNKEYQHGPNRYEGHQLKLYGGIFCCDDCWNGNLDGWAPHCESPLLKNIFNQKVFQSQQGILKDDYLGIKTVNRKELKIGYRKSEFLKSDYTI